MIRNGLTELIDHFEMPSMKKEWARDSNNKNRTIYAKWLWAIGDRTVQIGRFRCWHLPLFRCNEKKTDIRKLIKIHTYVSSMFITFFSDHWLSLDGARLGVSYFCNENNDFSPIEYYVVCDACQLVGEPAENASHYTAELSTRGKCTAHTFACHF